ncbi:hypothetical protein QEN19_004412 [Hanseniaspora menglaensis]
MDYLIEDLCANVLSESDISEFNLLQEDGRLQSQIKDIVEGVFNTGDSGIVTLDTFFISMADTPTVSGSSGAHRTLSNFNEKSLRFNGRDNIVTNIAELENTISIKENQLIETMISNGFDKKMVMKIDGDLNFDKSLKKGLESAFESVNVGELQASEGGNSDLIHELKQNQNKLSYLLKDGLVMQKLNELGKSNNIDLLDLSVLQSFLNLPSLVQECSKNEFYQEALFLQQTYLNSLYKYKAYVTKAKKQNDLLDETAGIQILDSIKDFITKVIKDDMISKLQDTLLTTSDFIILKRVVDVIAKVNQDDLKSLEMFIETRYKYLKDYLVQLSEHQTNIMDILDYFREELFNILNIYQLSFASNDTKRNLPDECFVKDFLLPCSIDYNENKKDLKLESSVESEKLPVGIPKYTNILVLKLLNDSFNTLLQEKFFNSENLNKKNCVLQLIYCAYRLKDSNVNYFHIMLNKLLESGLFTNDEITQSIEKRKELSLILNN